MQIQQLTYFVAIAEQGSINKAAEKLFVTQPNLSKAISNLENELKVRIFNRTNKGVALTDEGKKLYQYARTIINQMELIQGLSEKEHAPVLSIAAYPIITMGRLVAKFYNDYHDNRVALKLVENRLQQVIESVEHGEAEIGFVMSNNVQVKELKHMLKFKNLQFHALGTDTWYANLGPNHPLYSQERFFLIGCSFLQQVIIHGVHPFLKTSLIHSAILSCSSSARSRSRVRNRDVLTFPSLAWHSSAISVFVSEVKRNIFGLFQV